MPVYHHYQEIEPPRDPCVITIGSFDGLHQGHQLLIERVLNTAKTKAYQAAALTFDPHPAKLLAPRLSPPLLMLHQRKIEGLLSFGLDFVLSQRFDTEFAMLSAEDFVRILLAGRLCVRHVVIGDDFTFGRERRGTTEDLVELGKKYGFVVEVVRRLCVEGMAVSSTRVRSFLLQGRTKVAAMLLGRPYVIYGEVITGDGRGRTLGYPTANLQTDAELLPARGVYASRVWLESSNQSLLGVTNIGTRPTFGPGKLSVEVHLVDTQAELVGKHMVVGFAERLRAERTFENSRALVEQIERDVREARKIDTNLGPRQPLSPIDGNRISSCKKTPNA